MDLQIWRTIRTSKFDLARGVCLIVGTYQVATSTRQRNNDAEFISRNLDAWACREKVVLDFSRPGKPTDNAFIESFNARVRAECLNAHVFESLEDAKNILTNWRSDYNKFRPHSALGMLTPEEFAALSQRNEVPVDQNISA